MKLEPRKTSNPYSSTNQAGQAKPRVQPKPKQPAAGGNNNKKGGRRGREDDSTDEDEQPRKKQAAALKKAAKKNKGKQKEEEQEDYQGEDMFTKLPVDILHETCSYLNPATLLALSRTSKALRATLLSRKAEQVWVDARRAVGLADAYAPDFSEPKIAHLIADDKVCEVCGACQESTAEFIIRVRACDACFNRHLHTKNDHDGNPRADQQHHYWRFEVLAMQDKLLDLWQKDIVANAEGFNAAGPIEPKAEEKWEEVKEVKERDATATETFVVERRELIDKATRDSDMMDDWRNSVGVVAPAPAKKKTRRRRKNW